MSEANRDQNYVPVALGQSSTSATTTLPFLISSVTGRVLTDNATVTGDVVGPASATDNAVVLFDGITGKLIKNSTIKLVTTAFSPTVTDGVALGSTLLMWSDLFLASGAVINFNNGNMTIAHSAGNLAIAGGTLTVPASGLVINATTVTSTGVQLNYLNGATGTTGTTSTNIVFSTSPTLVTPVLGVASATSLATSAAIPLLLTNGQLVNIALTSQTVGATTLTIPDFASVADEFVFKTKSVTMSNKTFIAPVLGAALATSINGLVISSTTGTFTLTNAKTLAVTNTLTLSGTDSTVMTFPTTSATIARTDAGNTFTGASTASAWVLTSPTITTGITPTSSDGAALGSGTFMFADLFLASGGVINFNNGNYTITHSAGLLTTNGALTLAGTLALAANSITMTGSLAATGARVTKGWFTDLESTNMPTVGGTAILTSLTGPTFTTIEIGAAATDTTLSRAGAGDLAVEGVSVLTTSNTKTFTNKRRTRRLTTTNAPGATPTTNTDNVDVMNFTGLGTAITSMTTNLSGTPVDGDLLEFRFTDDGTARAITWGATFAATTIALPTTTVISTMLRVGFEYSGSTWKCIAVA